MATFAERLKEALEVKDIKAAQLARMIDVNEGTISQYKSSGSKESSDITFVFTLSATTGRV